MNTENSTSKETLPTYESLAGRRTSVRHERIAQISVMRDRFADPGETPEDVEIAFFTADGEWVLDVVDEFADYADPIAGDTRVYPGVPLDQVQHWVANHSGRDMSLGRTPSAQRAVTSTPAPGVLD